MVQTSKTDPSIFSKEDGVFVCTYRLNKNRFGKVKTARCTLDLQSGCRSQAWQVPSGLGWNHLSDSFPQRPYLWTANEGSSSLTRRCLKPYCKLEKVSTSTSWHHSQQYVKKLESLQGKILLTSKWSDIDQTFRLKAWKELEYALTTFVVWALVSRFVREYLLPIAVPVVRWYSNINIRGAKTGICRVCVSRSKT